jgi:hypothetical protein
MQPHLLISNDNASERAPVVADDTALICEPFLNFNDSLLSASTVPFSQLGKLSCITRTLVTKFFATSCVVAITNTLKSSLKQHAP